MAKPSLFENPLDLKQVSGPPAPGKSAPARPKATGFHSSVRPKGPHPDPDVMKMQKTLNAAGYHVAVDGVMGPQTAAAMKAAAARPHVQPPRVVQARPVSVIQRAVMESAHRGSGVIDPTRTGTDPARIAQVQGEQGGPSVAGYRFASNLFGPDLSAKIPGVSPTPGAGTRDFYVSHIGPVPIPGGTGVDLALLPFQIPSKTLRIARAGLGLKMGAPVGEGKTALRTIEGHGASTTIPAAGSHTGRFLEHLSDTIMPEGMRAKAAGNEAARTLKTKFTAESTQARELNRLTQIGNKIPVHQEYALRLLLEQDTPARAIAHHSALSEASMFHAGALAHQLHVKYANRASKYLKVNADGSVELSKFATPRMHEAYDLLKKNGAHREEIYLRLGRLQDEQIIARANRPRNVRGGAIWQTREKTALDALDANEPRKLYFDHIDHTVSDPIEAQAMKEWMDNAAWAHNPEDPSELWNKVKGIETFLKQEPGTQGTLFQGGAAARQSALRAQADDLMKQADRQLAELEAQGMAPAGDAAAKSSQAAAFREQSRLRAQAVALREEAERLEKKVARERMAGHHQQDPLFEHAPEAPGGGAQRDVLPSDLHLTARKATQLAKGIIAVNKLPKSINEEAHVAKVIQRFYNMAVRGAANKDWYDRAANNLAQLAAWNNVSPETIIRLAAVYSQRKSPSGSVPFILKAIKDFAEHGEVRTGMGAQRAKATEILRGGEPYTGQKTDSYSHNILASLLKNPDDRATIDSWMKRVGKEGGPDSVTALEYNLLQEISRAVAAELGWEPKQAQAAVWVIAKAEGLLRDNPTWSPEKALAEAKDAYDAGVARHGAQIKLDLGAVDKIAHDLEPATFPDPGAQGQEFTDFFTAATSGEHAPKVKPEWTFSDPAHQAFHEAALKHSGNFDAHIEASIPDYRGKEVRKGVAISKAFPGGKVLDIGASEGSWAKALSERGVETVSLDPNEAMHEFWSRTEVPGAAYAQETIGPGFDQFKQHTNYGAYDVVNESMTFQFISNDRRGQIAEVKKLLKPDGLAILDEKVLGPQWSKNEALKDTWKSQFFTTAQQKAKNKVVKFQGDSASGMMANMVQGDFLAKTLRANFKHVQPYWHEGNFVGYVASDSRETLDRFLKSYDYRDIPKSQIGEGAPPRLVDTDPAAAWEHLVSSTMPKLKNGKASTNKDIWAQGEQEILDMIERHPNLPESKYIRDLYNKSVEHGNSPPADTFFQTMGPDDIPNLSHDQLIAQIDGAIKYARTWHDVVPYVNEVVRRADELMGVAVCRPKSRPPPGRPWPRRIRSSRSCGTPARSSERSSWRPGITRATSLPITAWRLSTGRPRSWHRRTPAVRWRSRSKRRWRSRPSLRRRGRCAATRSTGGRSLSSCPPRTRRSWTTFATPCLATSTSAVPVTRRAARSTSRARTGSRAPSPSAPREQPSASRGTRISPRSVTSGLTSSWSTVMSPPKRCRRSPSRPRSRTRTNTALVLGRGCPSQRRESRCTRTTLVRSRGSWGLAAPRQKVSARPSPRSPGVWRGRTTTVRFPT